MIKEVTVKYQKEEDVEINIPTTILCENEAFTLDYVEYNKTSKSYSAMYVRAEG